MQIPLFRQIIIKKLRRSSRFFSAAPPEFLVFCFELFNENFQVRLLSSASLPSAVYVITSQGEEHAQEQIQEWSELPGCRALHKGPHAGKTAWKVPGSSMPQRAEYPASVTVARARNGTGP